MELSSYDIIKNIVTTDKSNKLFKSLGKLTFEVHKNANKVMIREAIQKIWNVEVAQVSILNCAGKTKTFSRRVFKTSDKKKAIVTLKKGHKIELPGHFETMGVSEATTAEKKRSVEEK
ncbi:50S ribosomal protein L23 [Candidatus Dependentiae bacterium]|nr:50S ribosomal protein L23 [Candidatus Dependentiae bacterium]